MAPKRVQIQPADHRRPAPKGYFSSAYNTLTSPENASVVRSIAVFGVSYTLPYSVLSLVYLRPADSGLPVIGDAGWI